MSPVIDIIIRIVFAISTMICVVISGTFIVGWAAYILEALERIADAQEVLAGTKTKENNEGTQT